MANARWESLLGGAQRGEVTKPAPADTVSPTKKKKSEYQDGNRNKMSDQAMVDWLIKGRGPKPL